MQRTVPFTRDLVLVGGGHAHALVLRAWGMDPLPGARLTLIEPGPVAPYTGMLPGHVAGHYSRDTLEIDLVQLCRHAGARLVEAPAVDADVEEEPVDEGPRRRRREGPEDERARDFPGRYQPFVVPIGASLTARPLGDRTPGSWLP